MRYILTTITFFFLFTTLIHSYTTTYIQKKDNGKIKYDLTCVNEEHMVYGFSTPAIIDYTEYVYDENGQLQKKKLFEPVYSEAKTMKYVLTTVTTMKYNNSGKLVLEVVEPVNEDSKTMIEHKYNREDEKVKTIVYDNENKIISQQNFTYNNSGLLNKTIITNYGKIKVNDPVTEEDSDSNVEEEDSDLSSKNVDEAEETEDEVDEIAQEEEIKYEWGVIETYTQYINYDDENFPIAQIELSVFDNGKEESTVWKNTFWKYNSKNMLLSEKIYDSLGKLVKHTHYWYDDKEETITKKLIQAEDNIIIEKYKDGVVIERKVIDTVNYPRTFTVTNYKYDKNNNKIFEQTVGNKKIDTGSTIRYKYDEEARMIEKVIEYYSGKTSFEQKIDFVYNSDGTMLKKVTLDDPDDFQLYQYDSYGMVIKFGVYKDDRLVELKVADIYLSLLKELGFVVAVPVDMNKEDDLVKIEDSLKEPKDNNKN